MLCFINIKYLVFKTKYIKISRYVGLEASVTMRSGVQNKF